MLSEWDRISLLSFGLKIRVLMFRVNFTGTNSGGSSGLNCDGFVIVYSLDEVFIGTIKSEFNYLSFIYPLLPSCPELFFGAVFEEYYLEKLLLRHCSILSFSIVYWFLNSKVSYFCKFKLPK